MENQELRIILRYEFKLGNKATVTFQNIQKAFGNVPITVRTIQRWFNKFKAGDISIENEARGRPKNSIENDELKNIIESKPSQTLTEVGDKLNCHASTVSRHLKAINKRRKLDRWVPYDLNEAHKKRRLEICSSLIIRNKNDPFLDRIVTCDEKWIVYDNRKRSYQWLDYEEAPKHMPKPGLFPKKVMVTVWWSSSGIVHYSFLKPGLTINSDSYCQEIEIMHQKLKVQHPGLVNRKGPILLHDNARPHTARITIQKLMELGYETLPHPAYSPDLSPTDYHLFKHFTNFLKGKKFEIQSSVENAFTEFIDSRNKDFYKTGMYKLVSRWQRCVESDGCYFE